MPQGHPTWAVTPDASLTTGLTPAQVNELTTAMTALVTLDSSSDNPVRLIIEDDNDGDMVVSPACGSLQ